MRYCFVLGRESELAAAEIAAVGASRQSELKSILTSPEVMIVETNRALDVAWWQERLGGTVKIGEVHNVVPTNGFVGHHDTIGKLILEAVGESDRKIKFGYSVYDAGAGVARVREVRESLGRGAAVQKQWLEARGHKVRWVTSRGETLSSVVVEKNLLGKSGVEVLVGVGRDRVILGRTITIQPFEAWSKRDFGRPARDMRVGMLPPKLARMMVNLAQVPEGGIVYDPFCGSGTVLMEALLMGYRVIGSDLDARGIEHTKENLMWLEKRHPEVRGRWNVFVSDVHQVTPRVKPGSVEAVVAEPYLGPPRLPQDPRAAQRAMAEVSEILQAGLSLASRVLKKGGRCIVVAPVWNMNKHRLRPQMELSHLKILGQPLRYARSDQHVMREIYVLKN